MANSLLDPWEIRPEPLRSEVQFGLVLAVWLCVNEEPPLVPFERQGRCCAGIQRQPLPLGPLGQATRPSKFPRIVAELRNGVRIGPSDLLSARLAIESDTSCPFSRAASDLPGRS